MKQTKSPRAVSIIPAAEAIPGQKACGGTLVWTPPAVGQTLAVSSQGCEDFPGLKIENWNTLRVGSVHVVNLRVGDLQLRAILDAHPIELKSIAKG